MSPFVDLEMDGGGMGGGDPFSSVEVTVGDASSQPDRPRSLAEAAAVQEGIARRAVLHETGPSWAEVELVAGVDVSYEKGGERLVSAAAVIETETMRLVEWSAVEGRRAFPYVPGYLAFREEPFILRALEKLRARPGLVVCDGYGVAHPRRAGLAVHLGVDTGMPCFGVAKTPFMFAYEQPGPRRGDSTPLMDGGEVVGRAVRTREVVKPVFVSVGNGVSLDNACDFTLRLATKSRLPEAIRWADFVSRRQLREGPQ